MRNYLLLLFALILLSCKKEDGPVKGDLLSTPLATTPCGFTGSIDDTYFYFGNSSSITYGTLGYYTFANNISANIPNLSLDNILNHLQTEDFDVSDSVFYAYFKPGNYEYFDENSSISSNENQYFVSIQYNKTTDDFESNFGSNQSPTSYYTLLDTVHTTYQNKTAIKYRAKFGCTLFKNTSGDSIRIKDGVIVGLFVKP